MAVSCQPPCEAVSWNGFVQKRWYRPVASASLWGCELKFITLILIPPSIVSLLVRLWVEMKAYGYSNIPKRSASLWGCELKWYEGRADERVTSTSASLWGCELKCRWCGHCTVRRRSASLWGCELKSCVCVCVCVCVCGQPPCEAVSWNTNFHELNLDWLLVSLLVRLWVEIVKISSVRVLGLSQPPCEAVSWNGSCGYINSWRYSQPPCEAVSWNV